MDRECSDLVIDARNLTRTYKTGDLEVQALRGVTLQVRRGEFVSIMGPSGSGKSTMMNLLGCLDRPTTGDYWLDGEEVSRLTGDQLADVRNRKIGFIFQGFNLLARTSAVENVEVPLLYAGVTSASERHRRSQEVLEMVNLGHRLDHVPTQLSGGEQQRVAIARALVNRPAILMADEPTGNLDSRTSVEIMRVFQELNRTQGLTILIVTHEHDIAQYALRNLTFRDGRLRSDTPVTNRFDAVKVLEEMRLRSEDE